MIRALVALVVAIVVVVALWFGVLLGLAAAERYFYGTMLPRVVSQVQVAAQKAVADGIRGGANGALQDMTGGILGKGTPSLDPCRVERSPGFVLPFGR